MNTYPNTVDIHSIISSKELDVYFVDNYPGTRYPRHIHYAQEQFVYCVSGESVHIIEGKEYRMKTGDWVYIPPKAWHESYNLEGGEVGRDLVVSHVVDVIKPVDFSDLPTGEIYFDSRDFAYAVSYCSSQHYEELSVPFAILDEFARPLYESSLFSKDDDRCMDCQQHYLDQPCLSENIDFLHTNPVDMQSFRCPYDIEIYHQNIRLHDRVIGAVRAQHTPLEAGGSDPSDTSKDMRAFEKLIYQIASNLENYCYYEATRKALLTRQRSLKKGNDRQNQLLGELQKSKDTILRFRMSNHFIFNAFNSMAALAIEDGNTQLYDAIIALADIMRSHSKKLDTVVSLREELHVVDSYVYMQRLRYGDRISFRRRVEKESLYDIEIPANSLLTIVENAFTHGFIKNVASLDVRITVKQSKGFIHLNVSNSGSQMSESELNRIRNGLPNNNGHGLSMVYDALKQEYGNINFDIGVRNGRTVVSISLPVKEKHYDTSHNSR